MITIDNFEYNKAKLIKLFQDMFQGTVEITEEEASDLGLIDEPKLINIDVIDNNEVQSTIESDVKDVEWNITNIDAFRKIILDENTIKLKIKDEYSINPLFTFENTDIITNEGEELHLIIKASINISNEETNVFATKNGYTDSNVLKVSLQVKSIFPNYIILSNDVIANKIGNNTYIAHFVPTEDMDLWIYDNANNELNNVCHITINKEEEPKEPLEGDFWYLSNEPLNEDDIPYYAEAQDAEDHKGWRYLDPNTDRLRIPYVETDNGDQAHWCIAVPASLGFNTIVNTANIDITNQFNPLNITVNNIEYNVWIMDDTTSKITGVYLIKSNNVPEEPQEDIITLEWSNTDLIISYIGDDPLNVFPELLMYKNGNFLKTSAVTENKLEIYKDEELVNYEYFINNKGIYYIYGNAAGARTETPIKWKVKEAEIVNNYRLEWDNTEFKILYIGDDVINNLPILNLYKNDLLIDNPDKSIDNLEIYLDNNKVDYNYMINNKGTYDIYYQLIFEEVPYITEEPVRVKIKNLQ